MPIQATKSTLVFKIKLLSSKNVVLVDCPGYESELFMPVIVKGRISMQNILPPHRCCNAETNAPALPVPKFGDVRIVAGTKTPHRISSDPYVGNLTSPLARSTPSSSSWSNKENVGSIQTPEQTRCQPSRKVASPNAVPLLALNTSSAIDLPAHNMVPPIIEDSVLMSSPLRPSLSSSLTHSQKTSSSQSSITGFKHRAPIRTYARKKPNSSNQPKSPISWSPLKKKKKTSKVSSTKPPSPCMKLEVRRRKLVVDSKKTLPTHELHKTTDTSISKTKIRRKQVTAKTRVQFDALKGTAFDQLISPAHTNVCSALYGQFQNACIDKFSETLPNYAELSRTAPLQMDRQVKSLIAKEKRLAKQMSQGQKASLLSRTKA